MIANSFMVTAQSWFRTVAFFIVVLVSVPVMPAETDDLAPIRESRVLTAEAAKAYQQEDFVTSLRHFRQAYKLRPYHPGLIYNVAALEARAGSPDSALVFLQRIADLGLYFPAGKDADFTSLNGDARFTETIAAIDRNNVPVITSQVVAKLSETDLLTEGIAFDQQSESFFVGSIYQRKIVRLGRNGEQSDYLRYPDADLFGVFGMRADPDKRRLWVCSSDVDQMKDREAVKGRAAIVIADLDSGGIVGRFEPVDTLDHIFGDLVLGGENLAFVSDSRTNAIYKVSLADGRFATVVSAGYFSSLQGITIFDDHLFVADYGQGIFKVDPTGSDLAMVASPDDVCLLGIDGLYVFENSLIAIQNGIRPHRIIRLFLDQDNSAIVRAKVLESNNPLFDEPTLGVVARSDFYFIANSQWRKFKGDGSGPDPDQELEEPVILKIDLR